MRHSLALVGIGFIVAAILAFAYLSQPTGPVTTAKTDRLQPPGVQTAFVMERFGK